MKKETRIVEIARVEKKRLKVFACKRCFVKFFSNIKLHQHVHDHHQKKSTTSLAMKFAKFISMFISSSSELVSFAISSKLVAIQNSSTSSTSSIESTLFATSKTQIFWAAIASKFVSSKLSRLSRFVSKFLFLFSSTSTIKTYLTIDDLFVMFVEKFMSIDLIHCQKNLFSSKDWRFSKFIIFHQTRITSYFLSSLNSFKFAVFSEKSLYLSIQTSVSRRRISLCEQIINFARESALNIHTTFEISKFFKNNLFKALYEDRKSTRLLFTFVTSCRLSSAIICFLSSFSTFLCSLHICCFCYDNFSFNNDLHRHLRFNHLSFTSRRRQKKT